MIKVKLRSKNSPQGEPVRLTLPASQEDELQARVKLGVGNLSECLFTFDELSDMPQTMGVLVGMKWDERFWQELNFFAQQLRALSHDDRLLLDNALAIEEPEDMKTVINLTYHLDNVVMADNINTDADLGRFLVEGGFGDFPESASPYLDFDKIGAEQQEDEGCVIINGVYYEDLASELKDVYDGLTLPQLDGGDAMQAPLCAPEVIATVQIWNDVLQERRKETLHATLELPAKKAVLEKTMRELQMLHGANHGGIEVIWKEQFHSLGSISREYKSPGDLSEVNRLTQRLAELTDTQRMQLSFLAHTYMDGWPDSEEKLERTLAGALRLVDNLSPGTKVLLDIADSAALGKYCVEEGALPEFVGLSERVLRCLDYERVGVDYCDSLHGCFHEGNFIYNLPTFAQLQAAFTEVEQVQFNEPEFGGM
jgi:hypothetical protein